MFLDLQFRGSVSTGIENKLILHCFPNALYPAGQLGDGKEQCLDLLCCANL